MKNIFYKLLIKLNIVIVYYLTYYNLINCTVQLLYLTYLSSLFTNYEINDEKNIWPIFYFAEKTAYSLINDEILIQNTTNYLLNFIKVPEVKRYYGVLAITIGNNTVFLETQFYKDCFSNEEYIKNFLKEINWKLLLKTFDNNLNNMYIHVINEYCTYMQLVEEDWNSSLYSIYNMQEIKQAANLILNKTLRDSHRIYVETLNLIDWPSYVKTIDYQTNNMKILQTIYKDIIITIKPDYVDIFKQDINTLMKESLKISLDIITYLKTTSKIEYLIVDAASIYNLIKKVLEPFDPLFESNPLAISTIPPIETHLITPTIINNLKEEFVKGKVLTILNTLPRYFHIFLEDDYIIIYLFCIQIIKIKL